MGSLRSEPSFRDAGETMRLSGAATQEGLNIRRFLNAPGRPASQEEGVR